MNKTTMISMTVFDSQENAAFARRLLLGHASFAADPDYSGDILTRSTLTGNWGGARNDLAKKGVTFDLNMTQIEQGVVDGGKDNRGAYGGRGELTLKVDTGKLGLWPGGFLTVGLEGNFGHGTNQRSGSLSAINANQLFPTAGSDQLNLPVLCFAQFLSEYGGVVAGKLDVIGGDMNEFAHGKGDSQFINLAFNLNPTLLMVAPYTPLGAGVIILPTKDPNAAIVAFSVISAVGNTYTTGFDDLDGNRLAYNLEARVRTDFFGMTGHQLIGGFYSHKDFTSIDQRLIFEPGLNSIAQKSDSWAVYYNFDQYLYEPIKGSGKGMGIFGRDGNPNPQQYFYSLGIGGKGVMASRPHDRFGLGWYYTDIKSPTFTGPFKTMQFVRNEQGIEAYYSAALTPWALLTPDIQYIHGAQEKTVALPAERKDIDSATILALRLQLIF